MGKAGLALSRKVTTNILNSLNAIGTFMCPYKIQKSMYFILMSNITKPIYSLMDVLKLGCERVKASDWLNAQLVAYVLQFDSRKAL